MPDRVSLTLSGHTHGGQVRMFGYSPMVPSRYGNRYAYGHIVEDNRHLVVSGGLGCSILPVRIGVPPEIVMVDVGRLSQCAAWPDLAGRLVEDAGGRRHVLPIRVYFEDTDFSGLVYHATYLRWCERGRSDFLRLMGNDHQALIAGAERTRARGLRGAAHAPGVSSSPRASTRCWR